MNLFPWIMCVVNGVVLFWWLVILVVDPTIKAHKWSRVVPPVVEVILTALFVGNFALALSAAG